MTGPKIGRYTPRNPAPLLTALIMPICIVSTCTMSNLFDHVKFYPVSLYHVNFCPVNLYLVSLQRMLFFVKIRNITDYIFTGWRESPKVTSSGETTLLAMYAVCCVYGYYYAVCFTTETTSALCSHWNLPNNTISQQPAFSTWRLALIIKAVVTTPHITSCYEIPLMRYGAPTKIVKFLGLQDKVYDDARQITALCMLSWTYGPFFSKK